MRTTIVRMFSILLLLRAGDSALAQCTRVISGSSANFNSVRLEYGDVPVELHEGITSGMAAWNATSCNTSGGTAFPQFVSSGAADQSIVVHYRRDRVIGVCARIEGALNGTGNVIELYSRVLYDGVEYDCPTAPDVVADQIAHELGHYLGLDGAPDDASCDSHIMALSRPVSTSGSTLELSNARQVQPDECSQANATNYTPQEYGPPPDEGGGGSGGDEGGGGGGGGDDGAGGICGGGQDAYAIDCGANGTWDYVVCLDWWDDPYEEADHRCNMT